MPCASDTRVTGYEPLFPPAALLDELPMSEAARATVEQSRAEVRAVLEGSDDRLLVIVGPCSVHERHRRVHGLRHHRRRTDRTSRRRPVTPPVLTRTERARAPATPPWAGG